MHEGQMLAEGTVDELDCETGVHKLVAIFLEFFSDVRGEDKKRTTLLTFDLLSKYSLCSRRCCVVVPEKASMTSSASWGRVIWDAAARNC